MSNVETLNTVLIRVYRSLLQYAGECWPWASANAQSTEAAVRDMAAEEQRLAERVFHWLDGRLPVVDLGTYPDNSSLHFVSLSFLLRRIVSDHAELAACLKQARSAVVNDAPAAQLVAEAHAIVERHLTRLNELAAKSAHAEVAA